MRLTRTALALAASAALALSLGACEVNIGSSGGSQETATPAQPSEQAPTQPTEQAPAPATQAAPAPSTESGEDDARITDSTWKGILETGTPQTVSGDYVVQDTGVTLNLKGDLDGLTIQSSEVTIAAEDVDTVTIQGSDVTLYARDIDHLMIQGSNVTVHWLDDDPVDITNVGSDNVTEQLVQ